MKENTTKYEVDENFLRLKYCEEKLSITQLTKLTGRSNVYISKKLKEFNIPKNEEFNDLKKRKKMLSNVSIEEFKKFYLDENLTYKEIGEKFGYTESQMEHLNSRVFHIKRNKEQKKNFMLRKLEKSTGKNGIIALNEQLSNARKEYSKKTGFSNPSLDPKVQENRKETFIKKYGVENPFQNEDVKNKIKNFYTEKYGNGITNPSQVISLKEKIQKSLSSALLSKRTNSENIELILDSENFKKFIIGLPKESRNYTIIANILNIDPTTVSNYIKKYNLENLMTIRSGRSKYEKEIIDYLKSIGITNIERNSKKYLSNSKEIDIYLPAFKIGIEFNGDYWHSELFLTQTYHQEKSLNGRNNGIFIFMIYEYEWNNSLFKDKIKKELKSLLISKKKTIYSKFCSVKKIDKIEKKEFLNKYSLYNDTKSLYDFGLFYKNNLIMVLSVSKENNKNYNWKIQRFCIKYGIAIINGYQKLFDYFIKNYVNNNEIIILYNNIGKFSNFNYLKLGFKELKITKPNYVWFGHHEIISKNKTRIKNETDIMHSKNYVRIFDSGNSLLIYKK